MTFYNTETAIIENGKLVLISNGGSRNPIGVAQARRDVRAIEASARELSPRTAARLSALKDGLALWDAAK